MCPCSWSYNSWYNRRWNDYNGSKKAKGDKVKPNGLQLRGKSLNFKSCSSEFKPSPMFKETNGKFTRSHSKGTGKENCIYNRKYFKSL